MSDVAAHTEHHYCAEGAARRQPNALGQSQRPKSAGSKTACATSPDEFGRQDACQSHGDADPKNEHRSAGAKDACAAPVHADASQKRREANIQAMLSDNVQLERQAVLPKYLKVCMLHLRNRMIHSYRLVKLQHAVSLWS